MVRGNWQKRVEQAEVRRKEAKQKKVIRSSKSVNKNLVQNHLFPLLNEIAFPITIFDDDPGKGGSGGGDKSKSDVNANNDDFIIHIWVDTPPSSVMVSYNFQYAIDDNDDYHDDEKQESMKSPVDNLRKSKKPEYNPKHPAIKKVHPRSHESISSPEGKRKNSIGEGPGGGEDDNAPLLCKSHFFNGRSKFSSKLTTKSSKKSSSFSSSKQNNILYEYNKKLKQKTLFDVLVGKKSTNIFQETNKTILEESAKAASSAYLQSKGIDEDDDGENNAVGMLYYYEIDLRQQVQAKSDKRTEESKIQTISDLVAHSLSSENCPLGSCAYVVYKNILLFDRYMGGVIVDKDDHEFLFLDESQKQLLATNDTSESHHQSSVDNYIGLKSLPVTVLEHILAFSDDEASGVLSRVCKSLNREIGKTSPALWLNLLKRKNWPTPILTEEEDEGKDTIIEQTRQMFLNHKNIVQAIDVMFDGIEYLQSNSTNPPVRHMLATRKVKENKDDTNACTGLYDWDDKTMILAHRKECTLSLFKAERNDDSYNTLSCKKIVCTRVAPFPHSRKSTCELQSFAIDKSSILCLYDVNGFCNWLILLKREDLLLNSADSVLDRGSFHCYELKQLLEESCNKSSAMDCIIEMLTTMDILFEDVEVSLHGRIVSCGGGFFIFLVDFLMSDEEEVDQDTTLDLIGRVLVQFSTMSKTFIWCMEIPSEMEPQSNKTHLSNFNVTSRTIVCSSSVFHPIITLHCEKRGDIISALHDLHEVACLPPMGVWGEVPDQLIRQSALSSTHAIFADVYEIEESSIMALSFFHLKADQSKELFSFFILKDMDRVFSLHVYGDYCIVLGNREQDLGIDEFGGHWFGAENERGQAGSLMVIIHIPSRIEIYRRWSRTTSFSDANMTFGDNIFCPHVFHVSGNENVAMSGQNLRALEISSSEKSIKNNKTKLKKKKKVSKNNKKDGFARGMSLRG